MLIYDVIEEVAKICGSLNAVELVNPINEKGERIKFRQNAEYKPTFKYNDEKIRKAIEQSQRLAEFRRILQQDHPRLVNNNDDADPAFGILMRRIDEADTTIGIAQSILDGDDKKTTAYAAIKYGMPRYWNPSVLKRANLTIDYSLAKNHGRELEKMKFDAEDIAKVFRNVMSIYEFDGWEVSVESDCSSIDVRDKNTAGIQKIVIPKNKIVSGLGLMKLIGHEIECHLRGSINSRMFWESILKDDYLCLAPILAKSDDELIYEGIAKRSDMQVMGEAGLPSKKYTVALKMASEGKDFSAIAYEVARLKNPEHPNPEKDGWVTARRVLRGSVDPNNASRYAFWKDRAYLDGFIQVCTRPTALAYHFSTMSVCDGKWIDNISILKTKINRDRYIRLHPELIGIIPS